MTLTVRTVSRGLKAAGVGESVGVAEVQAVAAAPVVPAAVPRRVDDTYRTVRSTKRGFGEFLDQAECTQGVQGEVLDTDRAALGELQGVDIDRLDVAGSGWCHCAGYGRS